MKILELTNYSAGICGVFARVKQEAVLLSARGHEVKIFSSNKTKGSKDIASRHDSLGSVEIIRFPATQWGGESFMSWKFEKEALDFGPDIIIAHSYRHIHTSKALKIARKIGAKIFLVTHAPFGREDTRGILGNLFVSLYDTLIGPSKLKKFDKVIAITRWEMPYLIKLGLPKSKIEYIPNGLSEEFYISTGKKREERKILFLGRVSPIKNLETVIEALPLLKDKKIVFEIVGPPEEDYLIKLKEIIEKQNLGKRVIFSKPIFDIKEKIRKLDSAEIFILPSISEGMPQSLIEAMARKNIVVASANKGSKDLVTHGKNGFLFSVRNIKDCAEVLDLAISANKKDKMRIKINAGKSVEKFAWKNIINSIEYLFK